MRSRCLRAIGAILVGLASASLARAAQGFEAPDRGITLVAGTLARVRWTRDVGPDERLREMELVLSLDGGRTFGVRVTGEVEPGVSQIDWRVPSLPTSQARLALRAGSGSRESERIVLVSEEFAIASPPDELEEPVLAVDAELRTREALELPGDAFPAAPAVASEPSISALADGPPFAPPTRPRLLSPPVIATGRPPTVTPAVLRPPASDGETSLRARLPLRL